MTEISTIIRARLDEGRAIADEVVRALLNENKNLKSALNEVMQWIHEWEPAFLQDDEWQATDMLVHQALYPLTPEERTSLGEKETTNDL
jgi:hypothetical protein